MISDKFPYTFSEFRVFVSFLNIFDQLSRTFVFLFHMHHNISSESRICEKPLHECNGILKFMKDATYSIAVFFTSRIPPSTAVLKQWNARFKTLLRVLQ